MSTKHKSGKKISEFRLHLQNAVVKKDLLKETVKEENSRDFSLRVKRANIIAAATTANYSPGSNKKATFS